MAFVRVARTLLLLQLTTWPNPPDALASARDDVHSARLSTPPTADTPHPHRSPFSLFSARVTFIPNGPHATASLASSYSPATPPTSISCAKAIPSQQSATTRARRSRVHTMRSMCGGGGGGQFACARASSARSTRWTAHQPRVIDTRPVDPAESSYSNSNPESTTGCSSKTGHDDGDDGGDDHANQTWAEDISLIKCRGLSNTRQVRRKGLKVAFVGGRRSLSGPWRAFRRSPCARARASLDVCCCSLWHAAHDIENATSATLTTPTDEPRPSGRRRVRRC